MGEKRHMSSLIVLGVTLTLFCQAAPVRTEAREIVLKANDTQISVEINEGLRSCTFYTDGWMCGRSITIDIASRLSMVRKEVTWLEEFQRQLSQGVKDAVEEMRLEKGNMAKKNVPGNDPAASQNKASEAKKRYGQIVRRAALKGGGIETDDPLHGFRMQASENVLARIAEAAKGGPLAYYGYEKSGTDGRRRADPGIESLETHPDGTIAAVYVLDNCFTMDDLSALMAKEEREAKDAVARHEKLSSFLAEQEKVFVGAYAELH